MFYGSTWVGEIYLRHDAPKTDDVLSQVGRVGSTALIIHSVVGFTTAIVLPWLVTSPGEDLKSTNFTPRPPASLQGVVGNFRFSKPSLLDVWTFGCTLFGSCLIFAPLVKSVGFATFLMAATGVPSAIAGLACSTYIGVEINRASSALPISHSRSRSRTREPSRRRSSSSEYELDRDPAKLHLRHSPDSITPSSSTGELSGIYLGILNIYTTLPQFIGTAISWVVFSILEPGKSPELAKDAKPDEQHSTDGLSGIAVCLFIGGLSAYMAAMASRKLKE
jgi:solute carrier family 45 protein 1/2/4